MHDHHTDLPRTLHYDPAWIRANSLGENAIAMVESLAQRMTLLPGMRVLDLGCVNAITSIFLAREFGVTVWAVDSKVDPTKNAHRINAMHLSARVFPIRALATELPFAEEYFDAIVAVDSYLYYGTDDTYLDYIAKFLRAGGELGIVDACFREELLSINDAPEHLRPHFVDLWSKLHSIPWWKAHLGKSNAVSVNVAEEVPAARAIFSEYIKSNARHSLEADLITAIKQDHGEMIRLFRLVARKA